MFAVGRYALCFRKLSTVLVQRGTLKKGKFLVAGSTWCKVRTLHDEHGQLLSGVPPSYPAEVSGWKDQMPSPGDIILEVETEVGKRLLIYFYMDYNALELHYKNG